MIVRKWWHELDAKLMGGPDTVLTVALLGVSLFGVWVALFGPRPLKAVVLGYFVFP